jgi:hypothetical protein
VREDQHCGQYAPRAADCREHDANGSKTLAGNAFYGGGIILSRFSCGDRAH